MSAPAPTRPNQAPPTLSKAEKKIYADVYDVLLIGMLVSTALFALGVVLALIHPRYVPLTRGYIVKNYHGAALLHNLVTLHPGAIMLVATVILILTPIVRVIISVFAFYQEGDRKYVGVTGTVLLVILLTVFLGWLGLK